MELISCRKKQSRKISGNKETFLKPLSDYNSCHILDTLRLTLFWIINHMFHLKVAYNSQFL